MLPLAGAGVGAGVGAGFVMDGVDIVAENTSRIILLSSSNDINNLSDRFRLISDPLLTHTHTHTKR
jgi:cell shape-determining protein MreC